MNYNLIFLSFIKYVEVINPIFKYFNKFIKNNNKILFNKFILQMFFAQREIRLLLRRRLGLISF